jgi:hypothetical protein
MDTAVNLIPFVVAASFMTWNAWLTWRWEGLLVERGTLPHRRFLVRRGSESWRWPWQSWQRKWGLDSPDPSHRSSNYGAGFSERRSSPMSLSSSPYWRGRIPDCAGRSENSRSEQEGSIRLLFELALGLPTMRPSDEPDQEQRGRSRDDPDHHGNHPKRSSCKLPDSQHSEQGKSDDANQNVFYALPSFQRVR